MVDVWVDVDAHQLELYSSPSCLTASSTRSSGGTSTRASSMRASRSSRSCWRCTRRGCQATSTWPVISSASPTSPISPSCAISWRRSMRLCSMRIHT
ncbi:hypothetical protein ACQJBY_047639 [Aegilops geniculata]